MFLTQAAFCYKFSLVRRPTSHVGGACRAPCFIPKLLLHDRTVVTIYLVHIATSKYKCKVEEKLGFEFSKFWS